MPENLDRFRRMLVYRGAGLGRFYCMCGDTPIPPTLSRIGNWSPSDFPDAATFPPYGSSGWQHANRDFLVIMEGSTVVKEFYKVFYEDWQRGKEWVPN